MANILEKTLLMGLGAWTLTRDKVKEAVNALVEEQEVEPEEARKLVDALVARGEKEREELRKIVRHEMDRVRPVARQEFEELGQRVDDLTAQIEQLREAVTEESEG